MSLLDTPEAQALLEEAVLEPEAVRGCAGRLTRFLQRYLPLFYRKEQRANAIVVMRGLLSDLERKTCEPVAYREGRTRKPIQFFVGAGKWDDEAVMEEVRQDVCERWGDPEGVLVLDPSGFAKKGDASCGVQRQWCGRLGKVENCQVGFFLAYATVHGHAPLDRRLYLPESWAGDSERRKRCHVPEEVTYRTKWELGVDMLERHRTRVPHGWVAGDDEFGRAGPFRAWLRAHGERYVLDVPSNTLVRDLGARRPRRRCVGRGRKKEPPFRRACDWADRQAASRWEHFKIRDGEKGPLEVRAIEARVRTKDAQRIGPEERLIVIRSIEAQPRTWYVLSNAGPEIPLVRLVAVHAERHRIEQVLEEAKGETGLAHYEVRSWVGWHHHMTLALLALWFLQTEKERMGKKSAGAHGAAGSADLLTLAS